MSENKRDTAPWVDPDDAPDLSDEFFEKAVWQIAGRTVTSEEGMAAMAAGLRRGRPVQATHKQPVTLRLDAQALAQLRATGKGWQTRAAQVLADWAKTQNRA
jgi:uncharacterized protein (DUF4415 family)